LERLRHISSGITARRNKAEWFHIAHRSEEVSAQVLGFIALARTVLRQGSGFSSR